MELIADGLLIAGAFCAALYCWVLSRRVEALKNLESGLGGAIAALSHRVEETRASLADTKAATGASTRELRELTARAEVAAGRLELLLASLHEGNKRTDVKSQSVEEARQRARDARDVKAAPAIAEEPASQDEDVLRTLRNIVEVMRK